MLTRDFADGLQDQFTLFGEVQRITPPVACMLASYQQQLGFELVNDRHQAAWLRSKRRRERLLGYGTRGR